MPIDVTILQIKIGVIGSEILPNRKGFRRRTEASEGNGIKFEG
jgi:hypothetical protein